jgi:hypothetical protein
MRGVRINYIYLSSPLNFVDQRRDSMYFTMAKTNKQTNKQTNKITKHLPGNTNNAERDKYTIIRKGEMNA